MGSIPGSVSMTKYTDKEWQMYMDEQFRENAKSQLVEYQRKINFAILKWSINECHVGTARALGVQLGLGVDKWIDHDDSIENENNDEDEVGVLEKIELEYDYDNTTDKNDEFFFATEQQRQQQKALSQDVDDDETQEELDSIMINNLKSIKTRNEIKLSILKGDIEEAFKLINSKFPNLLDKNNLIYFKLLHLRLIEMIRNHVVLKSQQHQHHKKMTEQEERDFLDSILNFVREKLSSFKILSNKSFIKDLELTMVLLCYTDELKKQYGGQGHGHGSGEDTSHHVKMKVPLKLRRLFNKQQRVRVAKLVNKAILIDLNYDDDVNMIRYEDNWMKLGSVTTEGGRTQSQNNNESNESNNQDNELDDDDHEADSEGDENNIDNKNNDNDDNDENDAETDLVMNFNQLENDKLESFIKLWIWSENKAGAVISSNAAKGQQQQQQQQIPKISLNL